MADRFTLSGLRLPPVQITGKPGDVVLRPEDPTKAFAFTASGVAGAVLRLDALDPAVATMEARFTGPTGGSPGAWTAISTGAGLSLSAYAAGATVYFQTRTTFAARSDAAVHRSPVSLRAAAKRPNGA
jgi:hypothetical protein